MFPKFYRARNEENETFVNKRHQNCPPRTLFKWTVRMLYCSGLGGWAFSLHRVINMMKEVPPISCRQCSYFQLLSGIYIRSLETTNIRTFYQITYVSFSNTVYTLDDWTIGQALKNLQSKQEQGRKERRSSRSRQTTISLRGGGGGDIKRQMH